MLDSSIDEGGGNLSLPDFERWASEQPSLIAWYEHLGDHWLSSIHAQSRSPVQNYRSQHQLSLRRAFQEMKIEDLVRDAQRRSGSWHDMDKRDFEGILRQFFRPPSMGVVDKLFSAYDIDQRGRIDGREALAGLCALAVGSQGHSERRHRGQSLTCLTRTAAAKSTAQSCSNACARSSC